MTLISGFRSSLTACLLCIPIVVVPSRSAHAMQPGTQALSPVDLQLKAELEKRAIRYFIEQSHPATGQTRDKAENFEATPSENRMASIAATGFSLATIINAGTRGTLSMDFAREYALKTVKFARDHVARKNGWFTHFYDWETGATYPGSEFSTIDTALFMGGALYAAQIFPNSEISSIVNKFYDEMDFADMLTDGGTKPDKKTITMGYFPGSGPGSGYTPAQWDMPAEEMMLYLMAIGHPSHPLPASSWLAWRRDTAKIANGKSLMGANQALFVHQYSTVFIDFRSFDDGFANYFDNAKLATEFNRDTCLHDNRFSTFRDGFWGLSAGLTPMGYAAADPISYASGTVCLGCAVGSVMFMPSEILSDVQTWVKGPYSSKIWGRYGLVDSIDLDHGWFATEVLGITVGPLYMSLADMDETTSFWKTYREIPNIKKALDLASHARLADQMP